MSKKNRKNVVYSTNPDYDYELDHEEDLETLPPSQQTLELHIDRKQRKGKTATLVKGFIGTPDDLKSLEKLLKAKCGVGGSSKDGEILIQGEVRNKIEGILQSEGYKTKKVGG
jgi:translation initiation factor 1